MREKLPKVRIQIGFMVVAVSDDYEVLKHGWNSGTCGKIYIFQKYIHAGFKE